MLRCPCWHHRVLPAVWPVKRDECPARLSVAVGRRWSHAVTGVVNREHHGARVDRYRRFTTSLPGPRARAMESVRGLSWGGAAHFVSPPRDDGAREKPPLSRGFREEAHTGFEAVSREMEVREPLRGNRLGVSVAHVTRPVLAR